MSYVFFPEHYTKTVKSGIHAKIGAGLLSDEQMQTVFGTCLLDDNGAHIEAEQGKELLGDLTIEEWIKFVEDANQALLDFLSRKKSAKR